MDVIRRRYGRLFSVELLHTGYVFFQQSRIGDSIGVRPDKETTRLFKNHGLDYHFEGGTLVCKMQSERLNPVNATPLIPFNAFVGNVRLRFLVFRDSDFLDRTQVIATGSQQVYQFTNQANAGTNGFIAQNETGVNNADLQTTIAVKPEKECFAVIDIHNNGAMNANYDLFGANTRLLSPAYRVRFAPKP
jgi:hypothetical protein